MIRNKQTDKQKHMKHTFQKKKKTKIQYKNSMQPFVDSTNNFR